MKISIIGPGVMKIPPVGWGAVESLIWDYANELENQGHEVQIVNHNNPLTIINEVNGFEPDFVHLQYDDLYYVLKDISCPYKAVTSHFGYIEYPQKYESYINIYHGFKQGDFSIICLSDSIKNFYLRNGFPESRLYMCNNGASKDLFRYSENVAYPDESIYLAKIEPRKRQWMFQGIDGLKFAGNISCYRFNSQDTNYLGEWTKDYLYDNLTNYSNLVLLSDGEADPLVIKEAFMAGLGVVVSKYAIANLDLELPFIDVVNETKINDKDYLNKIIKKNRVSSNNNRNNIRQYAIDNFAWDVIVQKYIGVVNSIRSSK